jgi:hypothetical protein
MSVLREQTADERDFEKGQTQALNSKFEVGIPPSSQRKIRQTASRRARTHVDPRHFRQTLEVR